MSKYQRGQIDDILASVDVREKEVDVPEWGCSLLVRGLTKRQQLEVRKNSQLANGETDQSQVELHLFMAGVVEPQFEPKHFGRLMDKSAGAIDRVNKEITDLSGMSETAVEDAKLGFPDESGPQEPDASSNGSGEDSA
jgi:hypothetical protein